MKTVSIIDPDPVIGSCLRNLIDASGRYMCVSTYLDSSSAKRGLLSQQPKIVIFEPCMPDACGIECIRWLKPRMEKTDFLAFTRHDDVNTVLTVMNAGATGYLCKRTKPHDMLGALDDLSSGGSPLSASVARVILEAFRGDESRPAAPFPAILTRRECEVLAEIMKGRMLKEITDTLGISQGTLNTHMRNLYRKLGVNSRCEIMARYFTGAFGSSSRPAFAGPIGAGMASQSGNRFNLKERAIERIG
ncbi:MAG TPA: response regulator transcription factor [Verrucomicrobiales bacterium]|nr:response regulator transcription factor [Verrucomicrobiales bacterium]